MTRDDLIRRLRRLARKRGVAFDIDREHGKGGHWMIRYGEVTQPVPQGGGKDLKRGLLHGILRNLGLKLRDLE